MRVEALTRPPSFTADAAESVGSLLRRTSLSALPQFILVLDGHEPVGYVDSLRVAILGARGASLEELIGNVMVPLPPPCRQTDHVQDVRVVMERAGSPLLAVVNARQHLLGWVHRADLSEVSQAGNSR